jgi:hypothetical protein
MKGQTEKTNASLFEVAFESFQLRKTELALKQFFAATTFTNQSPLE